MLLEYISKNWVTEIPWFFPSLTKRGEEEMRQRDRCVLEWLGGEQAPGQAVLRAGAAQDIWTGPWGSWGVGAGGHP